MRRFSQRRARTLSKVRPATLLLSATVAVVLPALLTGCESGPLNGGSSATTADHVIPHSKGGPTTPDNLVAACRPCNTSKGARTLSEWIASGLAPAPARELCHQRRRDGLPT